MNINYRSDYSTPDGFEQFLVQCKKDINRISGRLSLAEFTQDEEEVNRLVKRLKKLKVAETKTEQVINESKITF